MGAFAGFARGLVGGIAAGQERDMLKEITRGRGILPETAADTASLDASAARTAAPTDFKGGVSADPVAPGLAPYQKAFLNSIAGGVEGYGGESGGNYNIRYGGPNGAQTFEGTEHPRIFEDGPHGKSSAAGRYQFTASTWDDTGGGAFTPAAQDTRAWDLAAKRYKAFQGRDLGEDLQARGLGADILSTLTPTWQAFKNQDGAIKAYNASLARYGAGGGGTPAAVGGAGAAEAPPAPTNLVETLAGNFKRNVSAARENVVNLGTPGENWKSLRKIMGG